MLKNIFILIFYVNYWFFYVLGFFEMNLYYVNQPRIGAKVVLMKNIVYHNSKSFF